jgi:hypothetical protein
MGTFAETHQSSIIVYRLPTKENKFPFPFPLAENKRKFAIFVFHLQQTNRSHCLFSVSSLYGMRYIPVHSINFVVINFVPYNFLDMKII